MMRLEYGDVLMIYCIGSVALTALTPLTGSGSSCPMWGMMTLAPRCFALKEKINDLDDKDWAACFPKLLHNMAIYPDQDKENIRKCIAERREKLESLEKEGNTGLKYRYNTDDED